MKKTKKQRIKKMHFLLHRGIIKISLKGCWAKNLKLLNFGNTTFKRKGKSILYEYIKNNKN